MTIHCPCCNQPIQSDKAPIVDLEAAPWTKCERAIIASLVAAYPKYCTKQQLVAAIYSDGFRPADPFANLNVFMTHIRKKLPAFGWQLPSQTGGRRNYGYYYLEPLRPSNG